MTDTERSPLPNRLLFLLSAVGLFVAGYLWYLHANHAPIPCGGGSGCEVVAESRFAHFPVGSGPWVASYGTFGYIAILILAVLRVFNDDAKRDRLLLGGIVMGALLGTAFSGWLTYVEINVIRAICKWCLASQTIIALIFITSAWEFARLYLSRKTAGETVQQGIAA